MMYYPAKYYIESRYDNQLKSFSYYLIRYWFLLLALFNDGYHVRSTFSLILSLAIYFLLYDIFCYNNDRISLREENGTTRNSSFTKAFPWKQSLMFALTLVPLKYCEARSLFEFIQICLLLVVLCLVFFIHNRIQERLRVFTHFTLYSIKVGIVLISAGLEMPDIQSLVLISVLWNGVHSVFYFRKKFGLFPLERYKIELIRMTSYTLLWFLVDGSTIWLCAFFMIYGFGYLKSRYGF